MLNLISQYKDSNCGKFVNLNINSYFNHLTNYFYLTFLYFFNLLHFLPLTGYWYFFSYIYYFRISKWATYHYNFVKLFFITSGQKYIIKFVSLIYSLLLVSAIFTLIIGCGYLFYLTVFYLLANQNIVYFHLIRLCLLILVLMVIICKILYFNPSLTYNLTLKFIKLRKNNRKMVINVTSIPCYLIKIQKSKIFLNYTLIFYLSIILNLVVNLYSLNLPYVLTVFSKFVLISFFSFNMLSKLYYIYLINLSKSYIFNSFYYDNNNSFKTNLWLSIICNSVNMFNFILIYSYYLIQIIVSGFFVVILTDITFICWVIRQLFEILGLVNTIYCQPANNSPIIPNTGSSTSSVISSDNLIPITPFTPPLSPLLIHVNFLPDGYRPIGLGVVPRRLFPTVGGSVLPIAFPTMNIRPVNNFILNRPLFWNWVYENSRAMNYELDIILAIRRNVDIGVIQAESRALINSELDNLLTIFAKRVERNLNKYQFNNLDTTQAARDFWSLVETSFNTGNPISIPTLTITIHNN